MVSEIIELLQLLVFFLLGVLWGWYSDKSKNTKNINVKKFHFYSIIPLADKTAWYISAGKLTRKGKNFIDINGLVLSDKQFSFIPIPFNMYNLDDFETIDDINNFSYDLYCKLVNSSPKKGK